MEKLNRIKTIRAHGKLAISMTPQTGNTMNPLRLTMNAKSRFAISASEMEKRKPRSKLAPTNSSGANHRVRKPNAIRNPIWKTQASPTNPQRK